MKFNLEKSTLHKMLKFGITGLLNTGLDFAIFMLLTTLFMVNPYVAQTLSYSAGIANSYSLNRSWTFRAESKFFSKDMLKFLAVNLVLLGISLVVLAFFTEILAWPQLYAKVACIAIIMALGFVVNNMWVFKKQK